MSAVFMSKIAFILLCHKDPDAIIQQATQLTAIGDYIAIHFDRRAPASAYARIREGLADNPNVVFAKRREKCGWGEWSLVRATLNAIEAAVEAFPRATHFYMISGDCMPIKSGEYAHRFLDQSDFDYIESFDFFDSDWIKTGIREERLIYRHWFNERTQKRLFYWSFWAQRRLGFKRSIPADLQIMIGSQWWCLRRQTIEKILDFTRTRSDVMAFFSTTWIPDETFFQTLVPHLVPSREIQRRTLTFLMFTDYGMPVTFYNDHYDLLVGQNALFARKISSEARELKHKLGSLWDSDRLDFRISDEGKGLFRFLTGRGRIGQRFAPRFWEAEATLGRDRELMIIACKKWHVAKRMLATIDKETDIPTVAYLFNEETTPLPHLGGIERSIGKRTRHRRALMRMLFDSAKSDRMVICLDTSSLDLMRDFFADRSQTRLLEIECEFSDEYLAGHAKRVGLAGDETSPETMSQLLPTIRYDITAESDAIRDADFPKYSRLRVGLTRDEAAARIAGFLDVPLDKAYAIADTPHLFDD